MSAWLVDKSALWKLSQSPNATEWLRRINRGLVHVSLPTWLEFSYSARSSAHWTRLRADLEPLLLTSATPRSESTAIEIAEALVRAALHRAVSIPDIMIASIAAAERMTVLHDDTDFERIRDTYGAPECERLGL